MSSRPDTMNPILSNVRLYLVSDRRVTSGRDLADVVAALLAPLPMGAAAIQIREKDLPTRDLLALTRRLLTITRARQCPLLINGRLDVALAAGADGVHLPETGLSIPSVRQIAGPNTIIGASTHTPQRVAECARQGADLIVCGPIWATPSKAPFGPPLGLEAIDHAVRASAATGARLFAIGGVETSERARLAVQRGVHGIAGIRAFFAANDPALTAHAMYSATAPQGHSSGS